MAERMIIKDKHKLWHFIKNQRHYHVKGYQSRFIVMFLFIGVMIGGIAYGLPHLSDIDFEFDNNARLDNNPQTNDQMNNQINPIGNQQDSGQSDNPSTKTSPKSEEITLDNIHLYLSSDELVKALPKSAIIMFSIGEKDYTIEKESVTTGTPEEYDLEITISENYLEQLAQDGICETFGDAFHKEEASVNPILSQPELVWKYKSMYEYKSCLGI